jgi:hypothetical protein
LLVGEAFAGGTADILPGSGVGTFAARIGNLSVSVSPANYPLAVTTQGQLWVYYIDPTFAGGAVTAIATQLQTDFLNKVGYFLIDSVITPVYVASGGGRYSPSSYSDTGTRSTGTPTAAYDGNVATSASIAGNAVYSSGEISSSTMGVCGFAGFPAVTLSYATTLSVIASTSQSNSAVIPVTMSANINGTYVSMIASSLGVAQTTYTAAVPLGTPLNLCSVGGAVNGAADASTGYPTGVKSAHLSIFDIYIQ